MSRIICMETIALTSGGTLRVQDDKHLALVGTSVRRSPTTDWPISVRNPAEQADVSDLTLSKGAGLRLDELELSKVFPMK